MPLRRGTALVTCADGFIGSYPHNVLRAMKVLLYALKPFSLTHGGLQTQILQTQEALGKLGVETQFLRWWDADQGGDILQFFGRMPTPLLRLAQQKGMKV